MIKRDDFLNVIKQNEDDYQKFCEIKDLLLYNLDQNIFSQNCFSCKSSQHHVLNCKLLQYVPDREKIIKSYEFSETHDRRTAFKRKKKKSYKSLSNKKQIIENAKKFNRKLKSSESLKIRGPSQKPSIELSDVQNEISSNSFESRLSSISEENSSILETKEIDLKIPKEMMDSQKSGASSEKYSVPENIKYNEITEEPEKKKRNSDHKNLNHVIRNFDKYESYERYFPQDNIENVLKKYANKQQEVFIPREKQKEKLKKYSFYADLFQNKKDALGDEKKKIKNSFKFLPKVKTFFDKFENKQNK